MSCIDAADLSSATLNQSATQREDWIIQQALTVLESRIFKAGPALESPNAVRNYLRMKLVEEPNEIFAALFLDSRHQVIKYEALFQGTIDGTAVYPRVVVQRALALNAGAIVMAHQHPSGITEPSSADHRITERLKDALALVDIRLLDHFIIGQGEPYSFAERGLL